MCTVHYMPIRTRRASPAPASNSLPYQLTTYQLTNSYDYQLSSSLTDQMRIAISGLYDRHEPRDEPPAPPAPLPPLVAPPLIAPPLSASLLLQPTVANLSLEAAKVS